MFLLIKSSAFSTNSSYRGFKSTVRKLESRKWRINPPNTAQIVNTKLLDLHTGTGSLGCLSVTSGILNLKWMIINNQKPDL